MSEKETGGAAFPGLKIEWDQDGMDLRSYAAIKLRIPDSGIDWLDEMIAKAERRDIVVKIVQGNMANCEVDMTMETLIIGSFEVADTIIKKRGK